MYCRIMANTNEKESVGREAQYGMQTVFCPGWYAYLMTKRTEGVLMSCGGDSTSLRTKCSFRSEWRLKKTNKSQKRNLM